MGISLIELPILGPFKPVWNNGFGFWGPVLQLVSFSVVIICLGSERKPWVLQAAAKAFPIGADSSIAARCFGDFKALLFMPHLVAKAVPGFAFDVPR